MKWHLFHEWIPIETQTYFSNLHHPETGIVLNGAGEARTRILYACAHRHCSKVKTENIQGVWSLRDIKRGDRPHTSSNLL
jgi:hypothetical protein